MKKLLLIRFSSIGDIVLTTPVVRCIKQQVKDAELHFLTKENYREIIAYNPYIDKKHYLGGSLAQTVRQLEQERFDFVLDLHHNLRSFIVKTRLGAPSSSFRKLNIEKWLLVNLKWNRMPPGDHVVRRYFGAAEPLGVKDDGRGTDYFIPAEAGSAPERLPDSCRGGYFAFAIGGKFGTKKMPADKIARICQNARLPVVLLGGKEDMETGKWIAENSGGRAFNACGMFSINESAAVIQKAVKVIAHDTGMMHIAAALGKEIIVLWGSTAPALGMYPYYGAGRNKAHYVEVPGLACRPCSKLGYSQCPKGHFRCMQLQDEGKIAGLLNTPAF